MNLVLFDPTELEGKLPRSDPRAKHVLEVLRRMPGELFDVGLINGPRGKAHIARITSDTLELAFQWGEEPPPLLPITLIIGLPRPQTARKILKEASSLGVGDLIFFDSLKGEPSYAQSTLWSSNEWRDLVHAGVAQAFHTFIPDVIHYDSLLTVLNTYPVRENVAIALDVYEGTDRLSSMLETQIQRCPIPLPFTSIMLAIGPERGWAPLEREQLRAHNWSLAHLGERVLRSETAVIAALTLAASKLEQL